MELSSTILSQSDKQTSKNIKILQHRVKMWKIFQFSFHHSKTTSFLLMVLAQIISTWWLYWYDNSLTTVVHARYVNILTWIRGFRVIIAKRPGYKGNTIIYIHFGLLLMNSRTSAKWIYVPSAILERTDRNEFTQHWRSKSPHLYIELTRGGKERRRNRWHIIYVSEKRPFMTCPYFPNYFNIKRTLTFTFSVLPLH